ncbi:MAG: hypothetical protein HC880_01820 [Bacteroidia bacterium]|nr:hypothetical protein [Bacteroidia bacterium]
MDEEKVEEIYEQLTGIVNINLERAADQKPKISGSKPRNIWTLSMVRW